MNKFKKFKISDIFIGIIFTLFFLSIGVVFTINFRPLYYLDVGLLDIPESSGYPKDEIIANYDALIDYSSPFFKGSLSFPTLESSPSGLKHFEEVKDIFILFYRLSVFSLITVIMIVIYKYKKNDINYLAVSSLTAILLPIITGLFLAIDFDTAFVIFHKIFFNNDYWLFDPKTDPIINILPSTFFLHCALMIIAFILLGSLTLYIEYLRLKSQTGIKYRKNPGLNL